MDHNKLWKILKEMGMPDHLTYLLRNLYTGQETTVRTGQGTTDWFQIGKGVHQGYILSPCLFNLYTEYIMRNAGLDEAQAGIKIAGRNINNLLCRWHHPNGRNWRGTEELLDESEREEWKAGLKFNIQKAKIMASSPITSWQIVGEKVETVKYLIFSGSKINVDGDCSHKIKRCLLLGRKAMTNLDSVLKSRGITLLAKVHIGKAMDFLVVMYRYESWTIMKANCWRIDAFELWCQRRLNGLEFEQTLGDSEGQGGLGCCSP